MISNLSSTSRRSGHCWGKWTVFVLTHDSNSGFDRSMVEADWLNNTPCQIEYASPTVTISIKPLLGTALNSSLTSKLSCNKCSDKVTAYSYPYMISDCNQKP